MGRLTDLDLDALDRWAADDLRGAQQEHVWCALEEIRERREQDLTPNEIEHLVILRDMVDVNTKACRTRATTAALAVLDKLTRGNR